MALVRYVFIGDQGRVFRSSDEPTPEDLAYAAMGMVIIVRQTDCCYYGPECKWQPIPDRELGSAEVDCEDTASSHPIANNPAYPPPN